MTRVQRHVLMIRTCAFVLACARALAWERYLDDGSVFCRLLKLYDDSDPHGDGDVDGDAVAAAAAASAPGYEDGSGDQDVGSDDDGDSDDDHNHDDDDLEAAAETEAEEDRRRAEEAAEEELAAVFAQDEVDTAVWQHRSAIGSRSALADACRRGCLPAVEAVLRADPPRARALLHDTDEGGMTPLAFAASYVQQWSLSCASDALHAFAAPSPYNNAGAGPIEL
jgi:hypothetical protein